MVWEESQELTTFKNVIKSVLKEASSETPAFALMCKQAFDYIYIHKSDWFADD